MRTFLCLVLLSAVVGCAKSDARPLDVERAPELSVQPTSEPLPMPKVDVGEQQEKKRSKYAFQTNRGVIPCDD
jgi:hypothetical protein